MQSTVTKRGQTAVPLEIRKKFNIQANTKLEWFADDKVITVIPVAKDPISAFRGKSRRKNLTKVFFVKQKEEEIEKKS